MISTISMFSLLSILSLSSVFLSINASTLSRRPIDSKFSTIVAVNSKNEVRCNSHSGDVSLTNYMRLPVSQYAVIKMPLGATLSRVGMTNEFLLDVPSVKFFHLVCQPKVYCSVQQSNLDDTVTINSDKCILGGSPMVDSLNSHYKFNVKTQFTWADTNKGSKIISNSKILVYIDPPLIFKAFPRSLLESTGNLVMQVALNQIEKAFIKSLSEDYARWASDEAYRASRALLV